MSIFEFLTKVSSVMVRKQITVTSVNNYATICLGTNGYQIPLNLLFLVSTARSSRNSAAMMSVMMKTGSLSCRGFTNFIAKNTSVLSSSFAALVQWMLVKFLPHFRLFCLNCLPIWTILNLAYILYNLPCQVFQM